MKLLFLRKNGSVNRNYAASPISVKNVLFYCLEKLIMVECNENMCRCRLIVPKIPGSALRKRPKRFKGFKEESCDENISDTSCEINSESDDITVNSEMEEDDACLKDIKKAKKSRLLLLNS